MNRIIFVSLVLLALVSPVQAQRPWPRYWPNPYPPYPAYPVSSQQNVPNLDGVWYLTGNLFAQCQIQQRWPSNQAMFINEHGSWAPGTIIGDQVWIPTWGENGQGLMGRIEGDRIVWPDGNFWSRWRVSPSPIYPWP